MNENFKTQLAAFARDLNALCNMNARCIDRAVDVYTIEVEIERGGDTARNWTAEQGAQYAVDYLRRGYTVDDCATVRVLSAKRYVLKSHRESDREDAE